MAAADPTAEADRLAQNGERRRRQAERVQAVNAGTNVALAAAKLSIGALAGSPALIAHGVENVADITGNAVAWIGHKLSQRPPDEDHHYGHGHFEALATIVVGALILAGGGVVVWRTVASGPPSGAGVFGVLTVAAALVSAVVCEQVSRYTRRHARALTSPLLAALARDKRSDALTSLVVVVGTAGSAAGVRWLEPPIAVLMGVWIALMGLRSMLDGLDVLTNRVADPELRDELSAIAAGVPGVIAVQELRVQPIGSTFRVDAELSVDGALTVREGHEIAHDVERAIRARHESAEEVAVHVNPG